MSHVFNYRGQYFRVEVAEVANSDDPTKPAFAAWASEPFRELAKAPGQQCTRFVGGPPLSTSAQALEHAHQWIRQQADAHEARAPLSAAKPPKPTSVLYTVWLYKDEEPVGFDFENFWEAESFAEAAKKGIGILKVGIKNNESPQYLTVWERA